MSLCRGLSNLRSLCSFEDGENTSMFFDHFKQSVERELFGITVPASNLFSVYLGSALLLAVVTYIWFTYREASHRPEAISRGMLAYIFDKDVWLHRSAIQDYLYFIVNGVIYYGIITYFLISSRTFFEFFGHGFERVLGARETAMFEPTAVSAVLYTVVAITAIDFAVFLGHYLHHRISTLWHFHAVHHSAEVLTPATVARQHPVDLALTGTLITALSQLAFAGFTYMTMAEPKEMTVLNVNVILFVFFLLGYNLRHSHIWLSYPPWLSHILISPAQHQTHHSVDSKHFDKNFGFILAIWDWMFGTLYVPRGYERLEFGLSREEPNPYKSLRDMYLLPFSRAAEEFRTTSATDTHTEDPKPDSGVREG